jgi:hypothetical protein
MALKTFTLVEALQVVAEQCGVPIAAITSIEFDAEDYLTVHYQIYRGDREFLRLRD